MNERFFLLSKEKKDNMLNAAFRVFASSDYKKASMAEIAQAGDI